MIGIKFLGERDAYSQELSRYIHLNPVRAGLVRDPLSYKWSSYACYIGLTRKPEWISTDFILGYFKDGTSSAHENYQRFVESSSERLGKGLTDAVIGSTFLGSGDEL